MSGMTEHPEPLLSAYLDDALSPALRSVVRAHLDGCVSCRRRIDELRATTRLLAALPELAPARSLVPRVQSGWLWLRPVRLLGAIGTGAFLFLFLASAVINSGSSLGGGASTAETLAAQGKFGPAASALAAEDAQKRAGAATAVPVPATAASQGTTSAADSARTVAASPSPGPSLRPGSAAATAGMASVGETPRRELGPPPPLFLGLALVCAIAAFVAHRRLRRA